jgi:hypothetical protein
MLTEDQIVTALHAHFTKEGYNVEGLCNTTQHGVDMQVRCPTSGRRIFIEAKGGTSSRKGSARHGKDFTPTVVFQRVAKAIYTAMELQSSQNFRSGDMAAIALPDTPVFRKHLSRVAAGLNKLGIGVYLVAETDPPTVLFWNGTAN